MMALILRLVLATVFLYAGIAKFIDPAGLVESILQYRIVPEILVIPLALLLPPFEIISALALLTGPWKQQAAFNIALLCVTFLVALGYAISQGLVIECQCFGNLSSSSSGMLWPLLRNFCLLAMAIWIYRQEETTYRKDRD